MRIKTFAVQEEITPDFLRHLSHAITNGNLITDYLTLVPAEEVKHQQLPWGLLKGSAANAVKRCG